MAHSISAVVLAWVLGCGLSALGGGRVERTERYKRDHLIVKLRGDARGVAAKALATGLGGKVARRFRSSGAVLVKLGKGADVDEVLAAVRKRPDVAWAERDHYLRISRTVPNDPDFESCWGLDNQGQMLGTPDADIDAPEAWDIATGSSDVIVAVIDTGVDYTHNDLAANMWTNTAELNGKPGEDDDGNGYIDDVYGIAVVNGGAPTGDPDDDHGHGTHVAGILGAVGNNGVGIAGVAWSVKVMALKFMDSSGMGLESDAATCIDYAVAHGAAILNNSYGGDTWSEALYQAIAAANDAGVLLVAASGNESMDLDVLPSYPAAYDLPNIISVASTGGSDNISYFSNYGATTVDVGAPGESIWSTWPGNQYQLLDGTSMACPFAAGVAALVKSHVPGLTIAELRDRVVWTGDRLFDLQGTTVTGLRINAYNALAGIYATRITTPSPLPDATVGVSYSAPLAVQGFAPPYTWSWSAADYIERETANGFAASGVAQSWRADERVWHLDLSAAFPTGFPFYGNRYSGVYVCSNGYLEFAASTPAPSNEADIAALSQRRMIAAYWGDLSTDTDYSTDGDVYVWQPTTDSLAIRWKAEDFWTFDPEVNASVVLHADGRIEMHYGPVNSSLVGAVVGISDGDGVHYRASQAKSSQTWLAWAPTSLWTQGATPPGLSIDPASAEIAGTPSQAGLYDFDVTVEDSAGGGDSKQFGLEVREADGLLAAFEASARVGEAPLTVTFTDQSTSDTGITAWSWNFGDGTTSGQQSPQHVYTEPGLYTIALTVTDAGGADTETKLRHIEVRIPGPTVDFEAAPLQGVAPLDVQFTDLTVPLDEEIFIWSWTFGDGSAGSLDQHPLHTYTTPGIYDVTLEVIDWNFAQGSETKLLYITVLPDPAANTPPEAVPDTDTVVEDSLDNVIDVLANDEDDDGDTLTVTHVTTPAHGTATRFDDHVTYTPLPDYAGSDSFQYTIGDGNGGTDITTVTITVTNTNDPPFLAVPIGDVLVAENAPPTEIDLSAAFDDVDIATAGDVLTLSAVVNTTPDVADAVGQVSQATYTDYLDNWLYTHDGDNRGYGPEHDLARGNIEQLLGDFGLATSLDPFTYSSNTYYNVVGVQTGTTRPDDIYIVGAHYDSVSNPGADDNASGVAGVLEAARVLSQFEFDATLTFIAFDREEQGLHGSAAYAAEHSGDNILGMANLDMIAYNPEGDNHDKVRLYDYTVGGDIKADLATAFTLYGGGVLAVDSGQNGQSDHRPFEQQGFDATLIIEHEVWSNPHYHTQLDSFDTPGYIDTTFATNITSAVVGYLATAAGLADEPDLVAADIDGTTLTLTYSPGQTGSVTVTVRATDLLGEYVQDTVLVTVSGNLPAPPGGLDIVTNSFDNGTLNEDGPAARTLGIAAIGTGGNPDTTRFAIRIGSGDTSEWLVSIVEGEPSQVSPTGADPEWREAGDWEGVRIRGLAPGTTCEFHARTQNAVGESALTPVGSYATLRDGDVNGSGSATGLDYAHIKAASLRPGTVGNGHPWSCDLDDSGALDGADFGAAMDRALNPTP